MKIFRNWNREKVWKVKSESRKKGNKSEGFTGNVKLGQMFCFSGRQIMLTLIFAVPLNLISLSNKQL